MTFLRGVLSLLLVLAVPVAFLGPLLYFYLWVMNSSFSFWVLEWTAWAMGKTAKKFPQESFTVLRNLILVSWAYIIACLIFIGTFVRPKEASSVQSSAPAQKEALPSAYSPKKEKRRREPILKSVKMYVWQRDEGKCVECGSKEKLEYDHIIPLSKGGSNTERNLQLLCQRCNRSKGARIG